MASLPKFCLLNEVSQNFFFKQAKRFFKDDEGSQEDYLQNLYEYLWLDWIKKGKPEKDGKPLFYKANIVSKIILKDMLYKNKNFGRVTEYEWLQSFIDQNLKSNHNIYDLFDYCVPNNPVDKAAIQVYDIKTNFGFNIKLTYDEVAELTGLNRDSIRSYKSKKLPITVYTYEGKIYPNIKVMRSHKKIGHEKAKKFSEKVVLSFA